MTETEMTVYILRNWNREKTVNFCRHLLGDAAQKNVVFKNTSTNSRSTPCCKTDMVGVVAYYKCSTCGSIVEPERD